MAFALGTLLPLEIQATEPTTDRIIVRLRGAAPSLEKSALDRERIVRRLSAETAEPMQAIRVMGDGSHVVRLTRPLTLDRIRSMSLRSTDSDVVEVLPDRVFKPALVPGDPAYSDGRQWYLQAVNGINAPAAWDITTGSTGIVIGIIDTGRLSHVDLASRWVGGHDFVSVPARQNDGDPSAASCSTNPSDPDCRDTNPADPGDWVKPSDVAAGGPLFGADCTVGDSSWHGTAMAGVIGASANNGAGIAGINWNSKLLPVRAIGKCGGYESDIADAMRWAVGIAVPGAPANPNAADVLNVSLSAPGACSTALQAALSEVTAAGIPVVAAAGNQGEDASGYSPANCNGVIAVGAVDRNGGKAGYTNFGARVALSAPGGKATHHFVAGDTIANQWVHTTSDNGVLDGASNVRTVAANDNAILPVFGSSIAAAQVTGVVSLMLSVNPSLSVTSVRDILRNTARAFPLNTTTSGSQADCTQALCGAGILDARAAVAASQKWSSATPAVAGGGYTVALRADGTTFHWGNGTGAVIASGFSGVAEIAPDFALRADGTLWSVGPAPTRVAPSLSNVTKVTGNSSHGVALKSDGTVWEWGYTDTTNVFRPTPQQNATLSGIIAISSSGGRSVALKADGSLWYWGFGVDPFCTTPAKTDVPVQLPPISGVIAVAVSTIHVMALKSDGTVWSIGGSFYGEMGNGSSSCSNSWVQAQGLTGVTAISAAFGAYLSGGTSVALKSDGTVWVWGLGPKGQYGDGTFTDSRNVPTQVPSFTGANSVFAGSGGYVLATKTDGSVWGWGLNERGQLGIAGNANQSTPQRVLGVGGSGFLSLTQITYTVITTGAPAGSQQASNPVLVNGVSAGAVVTISGGQYSIDCVAPYTGSSGSISSGQRICVRITAPACDLSASASLSIAGLPTHTFTVFSELCDATPNTFAFTTQENAPTSTAVTSNTVTISGILGSVPISVYGGTYSIGCGGTFTADAGTVSSGATVCVRLTTAATTNTYATAVLTVGTFSASFVAVTGAAGSSGTPASVAFTTRPDVTPGSVITSNIVYITGISGAVPVSVTNGSYSIGCTTTFTTVAGSITNGQSVCVRVTASMTYDALTTAVLRIGSVDIPFTVITRSVPGFTTTPKIAAGRNSLGVRSDGVLYRWQYFNGATRVAVGTVLNAAETNKHTLILRSDGTVWAYGQNGTGQLGDGTTLDRSTPGLVPGLSSITAVAGGDWSPDSYVFYNKAWSLALRSDGTVWAWGYNEQGQLGDGTVVNRLVPVQVPGVSGAVAIAASRPGWSGSTGGLSPVPGTSYALLSNGTVLRWGNGTSTPTALPALSGITAIAAGSRHLLVLRNDGTVWALGSNTYGQLGNGASADSLSAYVQVSNLAGVAAISAAGENSLALKTDGTVWSWGDNWADQLGDGSNSPLSRVPVRVIGLDGVSAIAQGMTHGLALRPESVWAWGGSGQYRLAEPVLGESDSGNLLLQLQNTVPHPFSFVSVIGASLNEVVTSNPISVSGLGAGTASAITIVGGQYSVNGGAFRIDPSTVVNGDSVVVRVTAPNTYLGTASATLTIGGSLGESSTFLVRTRYEVSAARVVSTVRAGDSHTYLLSTDGVAFGAGYNGNGQLGNGTTVGASVLRPVAGLDGLIVISSGAFHGLALKADGTVVAWGSNAAGQLGSNSSAANAKYSVPVSGLSDVAAISAGKYHSVALRHNGSVYAWGLNTAGQLGDGSLSNRSAPVIVPGVGNVVAIAAGGRHTLALLSNGSVRAWGANETGQLGDGTTQNRTTPVTVSGLTGVVAIAAGDAHSLAIKSDGSVVAWGFNAFGQLGDGTTSDRLTPVAVTGLSSGVGLIAAGANHSLAVKAGGALYAWGNNANSQIGNGNNTNQHSPYALTNPSGVTGIAAGARHSAAITTSRRLFVWGDNFFGQVGNRSGNYNPHSATLNVLRGDSLISTGTTSSGTSVGTGANSGSAVLQIDSQQSSFDFGSAAPGSTASVGGKYKNAAATVNVTGVAISVEGSAFGVTNVTCPSTLFPDQECDFTIRFTPAGAGSYEGQLVVQSSVDGAPERRALSGTGLPPAAPAVRFDTGGLDFPPQALLAPLIATVTLTNTGAAPLSVSQVTSSLPDFTATHNCTNIAAGTTCSLTVTFKPTAGAARVGQLTLTSNASGSPHALTVSGTGVGGNAPPPPNPPRLFNIATRGPVLTNDDVMIAGFIIGGSVPKTVLVRARGPSLAQFNVPGVLANPRMDLYSGQTVIASNDNWVDASNKAAIELTGFAPENSQESAILTTLAPGPYTAIVSGVGNATGIGIVEVFEAGEATTGLHNIATRGQTKTGDDVMIAGFIIQGDGPQTVLIRARGPSLTQFGVPGVLANPKLDLYSGQTVIASNDNWVDSPDKVAIQASGNAPGDPNEAAILTTLQPGGYTAIVTGVGGGTGVAIVEVFRN